MQFDVTTVTLRVLGCAGVYLFIFVWLVREYLIPNFILELAYSNRSHITNTPGGVGWLPNQTYSPPIPEVTNIAGWEWNVTRAVSLYIDIDDTAIIPGKNICKNSTRMVIIVATAPNDSSARNLIRETWGSSQVRGVKVGFLVGLTSEQNQSSLEAEDERFQDIIQDNFVDSYTNLTMKSIAMLKWYVENCPDTPFLMKSDADTFVDVEMLVSSLLEYNTSHLVGCLCSACKAIHSGHWGVPRYIYPNKTYPDYLFGFAYIMTRDVAEKLLEAALRTPIFPVEDIYVTGFCAKAAGVVPGQFPGCANFLETKDPERRCPQNQTMCNPMSSKDMKYLWKTRCTKTASASQRHPRVSLVVILFGSIAPMRPFSSTL